MPQSKRHPARRPQQRSPRSPNHRSPAAKAAPAPATGFRAWLERTSAGPLILMHRMPSFLVPALLAVCLAAGLIISSAWAAVFLVVVLLFLLWLVALAWPVLPARGRLIRALVIVALLGVVVLKLTGRL